MDDSESVEMLRATRSGDVGVLLQTLSGMDEAAWQRHLASGHMLHVAAKSGRLEVFEHLVGFLTVFYSYQSSSAKPAIHLQDEIARVLNAPRRKGQTALMFACWNGHALVVKYLMQQGADPSIATKSGRTALHFAALGGRSECVTAVLDNLRPDSVPQDRLLATLTPCGFSPLMYAAANGDAATVRALLKYGPDLLTATTSCNGPDEPFAMQDCTGVTALHIAARWDYRDVAVELLRFFYEAGHRSSKDPRRRLNSQKRTPFALARQNGHDDMTELLRPQALLDHFALEEPVYFAIPKLQALAARAVQSHLLASLTVVDRERRLAACGNNRGGGSRLPLGAGGSVCGSCSSSSSGSWCGGSSGVWSRSRTLDDINFTGNMILGCTDDLLGGTSSSAAAAAGGLKADMVSCVWDDDASCGVCMDAFESVELSPCRHRLCPTCAGRLAQMIVLSPATCPFCREPLRCFKAASFGGCVPPVPAKYIK